MRENELFKQIARIASGAEALVGALNQIQSLLASEWGGALLIVREASGDSSTLFPSAACEFLESRAFPFRGLYAATLHIGSGRRAKLVACIGSWGAPDDGLRRAIDFVGEQLSKLASRLSVQQSRYLEAA